jgi:hypothetical protein
MVDPEKPLLDRLYEAINCGLQVVANQGPYLTRSGFDFPPEA